MQLEEGRLPLRRGAATNYSGDMAVAAAAPVRRINLIECGVRRYYQRRSQSPEEQGQTRLKRAEGRTAGLRVPRVRSAPRRWWRSTLNTLQRAVE